jgi:hypothetical protein
MNGAGVAVTERRDLSIADHRLTAGEIIWEYQLKESLDSAVRFQERKIV